MDQDAIVFRYTQAAHYLSADALVELVEVDRFPNGDPMIDGACGVRVLDDSACSAVAGPYGWKGLWVFWANLNPITPAARRAKAMFYREAK